MPRARLRTADLARLLAAWAVSTLALVVSGELLPGLEADSWWSFAAAAAVAGLVGVLVRPVLVEVAAAIGWVAVIALAVTGQAVVTGIALWIVPGISATSFWTSLAAAWIAAAAGTLLSFLASVGTSESLSASLRRQGRRPPDLPDPDVDGVLFVQLDGVPFPVMRWALQSGTMPTLRRWTGSGSHVLREWTVQLPCTTPASQLGILHGTCAQVPAFRWYDRELGRVLVANHPPDAALIEERASTGRGLLADDGMSCSNLFSGDAPRCSMTMSRVALGRGTRATRQAFAWFLVRPDGLARSLVRTVGEVGRERMQALRQVRLDVRPRVHRSWTFAALRALSNGLLRDVNTAVVAAEMLRGTRSIYVDYVDYDEVAHHAGGTRIEALAALGALDRVLAVLEEVAAVAPRRYRIVVLSDHGQSMGEPFASRFGEDLAGVCAGLAETEVTSLERDAEGWGRVESLVDDLGGGGGAAQRVATGLSGRIPGADHGDRSPGRVPDRHRPDGEGPGRGQGGAGPGEDRQDSRPHLPLVLGSGNLALVHLGLDRRLDLAEITARWPRLVPGLLSHPGVGFVVAATPAGPVALGPGGRRELVTGDVEGTDPLAPFGRHAPGRVRAMAELDEAPDLYVNSTVEPGTLEVAAFEDLVGCHGGLGGWQDRGVLVAPADLDLGPGDVVGAEDLHGRLVRVLEGLGHRAHLTDGAALPRTSEAAS